MAKYSLDFGPQANGTPQFTVFRNLNSGEDLLGVAPTLDPVMSGIWEFTYASGIVAQFRVELDYAYIAGTLDPRVEYPLGEGSVRVDHDYGGTDALRVQDSATLAGIDNAFVYAYLTSDYSAGRTNKALYLKGWCVTDVEGRWETPIYLDPGSYTLLIVATGHQNRATTVTIT